MMEHHASNTEEQHPDICRHMRRSVHQRLQSHRITYRELVRALMELGVVVETNKHGSGHIILRHGEKQAAVVSGARKISDTWKPGDVIRILRKLEIPEERFLAAVSGAGMRNAEECENTPDVVEI